MRVNYRDGAISLREVGAVLILRSTTMRRRFLRRVFRGCSKLVLKTRLRVESVARRPGERPEPHKKIGSRPYLSLSLTSLEQSSRQLLVPFTTTILVFGSIPDIVPKKHRSE